MSLVLLKLMKEYGILIEGMSHEEIVATVIYFLHSNDAMKGGNILFKRAFDKEHTQEMQEEIREASGQH
jgi:hypothetical protein